MTTTDKNTQEIGGKFTLRNIFTVRQFESRALPHLRWSWDQKWNAAKVGRFTSASSWPRCASGWRFVSVPCSLKRSFTTTKCVFGWFPILRRFCSARTASSPSTTRSDQRPARVRCTSPASSLWWSPWSTDTTRPSSVTARRALARHTH